MSRELFDVAKLAGKEVRRSLSKSRLFLQRLSQAMRHQHSQIEIVDPDVGRRLVLVLFDQSDSLRCVKGRSTGEHLVKYDAQAVDVCLHTRSVAGELFWCKI